jgi:hypothetical protein
MGPNLFFKFRVDAVLNLGQLSTPPVVNAEIYKAGTQLPLVTVNLQPVAPGSVSYANDLATCPQITLLATDTAYAVVIASGTYAEKETTAPAKP